MSFRRIPFQFTTTDPVERQRELERRFGLSSSNSMHIDDPNPLGAVQKETNSPRLQHRVPIFTEGFDHGVHSSVDSMVCTSENKKSNVRVIPIEIERPENRPITKRRNFSVPAEMPKEQKDDSISKNYDASPVKRSMVDLAKPAKMKHSVGSRVHNIPIQVEDGNSLTKSPEEINKEMKPKMTFSEVNGCVNSNNVEFHDKEQKSHPEMIKDQNNGLFRTGVESLLKKIENVLIELKIYETGVQEFSGTTKDSQYRYLDEMLTRCMLKLDDIDTMGNESIRLARKNAVRKIQTIIDLLETKANSENEVTCKQERIKSSEKSTDKIANEIKQNDVELQDNGPNLTVESDIKSSEVPGTSSEDICKNEPQNQISDQVEGKQETDILSEKQVTYEESKEIQSISPPSTTENVNDMEMLIESQADADKSSEVPMEEIAGIQEISLSNDLNSESPVEKMEINDNDNHHSKLKSDLIERNVSETEIQPLNEVTEGTTTETY